MQRTTSGGLRPLLSGSRLTTRFAGYSMGEVIQKTIEQHPSKIAVLTSESGSFTYGDLAKAGYELVDRLKGSGVRKGDRVALKLPRSVDFLIAVLAGQFMNFTFVPIDPSESELRTKQICGSTGTKAIVTKLSNGSIAVEAVSVVQESIQSDPVLSYIMHTSGSTGVPKGVPVAEVALLNMVDWYIDMISFTENSSISFLTRPTFDVSIPEFYVPFCTGATVVLPQQQFVTQVIETVRFLGETNTNVIQLVPTLLQRFLATLERSPQMAEHFYALKYLVCNGEALPDSLRRRFYRALPNSTLINSYGPTECCVAVGYHICSTDDSEREMFIGMPARNVDYYVLDDRLASVGFGTEGELWLGGVQTSPGYVANEAQSQARFPTCKTVEGREVLYRTGDYVVASRENGLRFMGRKDDQIKYRGVRLEKGEITTAVDRTGLCLDSAVLVVSSEDNGTQDLACFVTPDNVDEEKLRRQLAKLLPDDRVPGLIISLKEFPHTGNGKLDRRALENLAREALLSRYESAGSVPQRDASASPIECLLRAVHSVTKRWATPASVVGDFRIDSLGFLEIQLFLAEMGLVFKQDVFHEQEVTLSDWADRLKPMGQSVAKSARLSHSPPEENAVRKELTASFKEELDRIVNEIENQNPTIITLHSSLVAFRGVDPSETVSALLQVIRRLSSFSTVLLPAFTMSYCATRCFHWRDTNSETGILADLVLQNLPAKRTKHPVYSMAAVGPRAGELCDVDWWRWEPFGDNSIFGAMSQLGGVIVGLGTPSFTHVHRCELLANVPYMKTVNLQGLFDFGRGPMDASASVYIRDVRGRPEFDFLAHDSLRDIKEMGDKLRTFAIAGSYARFVSMRDLELSLVPAMRSEPFGFLYEDRRQRAQEAYPPEYQLQGLA